MINETPTLCRRFCLHFRRLSATGTRMLNTGETGTASCFQALPVVTRDFQKKL
jgi:hypothetical protein